MFKTIFSLSPNALFETSYLNNNLFLYEYMKIGLFNFKYNDWF
jgi:hypothetical protein